MANRLIDKFSLLSKMGRGGDTELRYVKGELSHVNPTEATAVDVYGEQGEQAVASTGSGTINPNTGLREYQGGPEAIIAALAWLSSEVTGAGQRKETMDVAKKQAGLYQDLIGVSEKKVSTFPGMETAEIGIQKMLTQPQYQKVGVEGDIAAGNITKALGDLTQKTRGIEEVGTVAAVGAKAEKRLFGGISSSYQDIGAKYIASEFDITQKYKDLTAEEQAKQTELGYKRDIEKRKSQGLFMGEHRGLDILGGKTSRFTWGDRPGWG